MDNTIQIDNKVCRVLLQDTLIKAENWRTSLCKKEFQTPQALLLASRLFITDTIRLSSSG